MKNAIAIIIAGALIAGAIVYFSSENESASGPYSSQDNVYMEDGTQIVEIAAKGGYMPRASSAKAGVPTIIRVTTKSTFDCSASLSLPSLGIQKSLPMNGTTDIDIGTPSAGEFSGTCGMGMYGFNIDFKS
jgi:plastocyanin domain-containing protein